MMAGMDKQRCLECGMQMPARVRRCPKCDNPIDQQTDGSTVQTDIAHQGERVHEALDKLHEAIHQEKDGYARYLRLVVGGGAIREAVAAELGALTRRRVIKRFTADGANKGAFKIQLK